MKKKILVFLSLILVLSVFITGCVPKADDTNAGDKDKPAADEGKDVEKILRTNNASEPGSLDPALAQGTHESWVLDHTFEGLMKINPDLEIVPGMAKKYKVSDDNLTYTFTLRDDIKWSNGDPVTAEDFEFA